MTDVIRLGWTMLTGFGLVFALWNVREVLIDNWAISQVQTTPKRPVEVLKLQTRAEVWAHVLILGAIGGDFIAGVCSLVGFSLGALIALIASAAALIVLSFSQTRRRQRIFRALRLRPQQDAETP